jgi:hypothetical protein
MNEEFFEDGYNTFWQNLNSSKTYSCPHNYWTWEATEWEAGWAKAKKEAHNATIRKEQTFNKDPFYE